MAWLAAYGVVETATDGEVVEVGVGKAKADGTPPFA
jgi:hypothetical protein